MIETRSPERIPIRRPLIHPQITAIGYGNPRYNSLLPYKNGVLVPVGTHLRWVDIQNNKVLFDKQIGCSQILQLMGNSKYILTINFEGLVTLFNKDDLVIKHQFYTPGKEIRHSCLTNYAHNNYLVVSCELNEGIYCSLLVIYSLDDIQSGKYEPLQEFKGFYSYPQFHLGCLTVIEYIDPNPKGRKKQGPSDKKLPITNRIVKFSKDFSFSRSFEIQSQGKIICAAQKNGIIYYLHNSKKATFFDIARQRVAEAPLQSKNFPLLFEAYEDGVLFVSSSNNISKIRHDFEEERLIYNNFEIKSLSVGGNYSLKFSTNGHYSLNQHGLHFYNKAYHKTYTQSLSSITNCGLTLNESGDLLAVGDFGGTLRIFSTEKTSDLPVPLYSILLGGPIRSIAWCSSSKNIVIGCLGGSLFLWQYGSAQAILVDQIDNSINILRAIDGKIFAGTSDGFIKIYDSKSMKMIYQFKAHHPVNYDSHQQRELFGSMKNYAEIWSLTHSPNKKEACLISSSEDQTEKVFRIDINSKSFTQENIFKGHVLAVTSIDWKMMNEKLGQIYVSCSDDQVIRFRDPKNNFKVLFQLETSSIKEWHTLTYLALEPNGSRVAIGAQNGYLIIYDIQQKELQFAENLHMGGIEGLDWRNGKIVTCSSDLCLNIVSL